MPCRGLAGRPLSIVRCPDGIGGEHFFQKNGHGHLPLQIREGSVSGSPYLAIDDVSGLIALTQMSAIELHPWGASEADPLHPDWLVFDLDPGETVAFDEVVKAAHDVRGRLKQIGPHLVLPYDRRQGASCCRSDDPVCRLGHSQAVLPRLCGVGQPGRARRGFWRI